MAMVGEPQIVCLDEPTSGVDTSVRAEIWQYLAGREQKDRVMIVASHDAEEIELVASQIVVMFDGQDDESGTFESIMHAHNLNYVLQVFQID